MASFCISAIYRNTRFLGTSSQVWNIYSSISLDHHHPPHPSCTIPAPPPHTSPSPISSSLSPNLHPNPHPPKTPQPNQNPLQSPSHDAPQHTQPASHAGSRIPIHIQPTIRQQGIQVPSTRNPGQSHFISGKATSWSFSFLFFSRFPNPHLQRRLLWPREEGKRKAGWAGSGRKSERPFPSLFFLMRDIFV